MNIKKKERPILVDISLKEKREGVVRVKTKQAGATRKKSVLGAILDSTGCAFEQSRMMQVEKLAQIAVKELQEEPVGFVPIKRPPRSRFGNKRIKSQLRKIRIKTPPGNRIKKKNKYGKER